MKNEINQELRLYSDRRQNPTPLFSKYTFWGGRRRTIRRDKDKEKHLFVDLYSTRLLVAVILLLCLSCLDAFLTLLLIERGIAVEANPIMAHLLGYGIFPFIVIKFIVTALGITVLTLFKNVKITRFSLPFAIKIYAVVILYEIYLYSL